MIEINARILIENGTEPSALEAAVLAAIGGQPASAAEATTDAAAAPEAPAPRKTRGPRKAAAPAEVPMALEESDEVPGDPGADETATSDDTESDEDLLGGDDDAPEAATLDDAVAAATAAVAKKQTAKVKSALQEVGATKVSQLKGKAIQQFVDLMAE